MRKAMLALTLFALGYGSFCLSHKKRPVSLQDELRAISLVESSGGKNLHYKRMRRGIHRKTRAGGYYGIMPKTARHVILTTPALRKKYSHWARAKAEAVTAELNQNREFDQEIATTLWSDFRQTMTADQAACAWFWGPKDRDCLKSDVTQVAYVQKYDARFKEVLAHGQ